MLQKQHKVDSSHYDMPLIYYTEGHSLHFGHPEFALIIGSSVTNLDLIGVIEDEETFQKLCDEDSIRLCLILCLEVIFLGRLLTCPVDDTLFRLVESLEDWNCFPWGEHIWTHLYDHIQNVIEKHSDEHYFGMKKDPKYVPMYTLSGFVFAFQVWIFESFERCNCWWSKDPNVIPRAVGWSKSLSLTDLIVVTFLRRPSKAEYESSWWIRSQLIFRQHVPKDPVAQHHSMYETYLAKLEKSRKRVHSSFRTSSLVLTTLISTPKKWIRDQVISQLNLRVFKLETIIQVLARERKNEYGLLQFKDEFSRLGHYLVEEELRLCLEAEEHMRLEHEKNIIEESSFMVKEAKRMKLEEEKLLQISREGNIKCKFPWSDVDQVFFPINETAQHWCRAHFDIVSGLVTFYDSGDTYDYESCNFYVRVRECLKFIIATYANSGDDKEMMIKLFEIDNERDFRAVRDTYASCQVLNLRCQDKREQMIEMQPFLHLSPVLAESYNLLKELQDYELEKLAMAYSESSGSSKKVVPKYVKFMVLEKISECKRTINFIVGEVQNATSHLEHLNGMIEMLEGMHFTLEIYDSVWCLSEMVKSENKKLNDLNKQLLDAEEDIRVKEKCLEILEEAIYYN
ncbi:phospholipase-like protein [Tanacetum coccineum]